LYALQRSNKCLAKKQRMPSDKNMRSKTDKNKAQMVKPDRRGFCDTTDFLICP